jgi:hypothetical protein
MNYQNLHLLQVLTRSMGKPLNFIKTGCPLGEGLASFMIPGFFSAVLSEFISDGFGFA